MKKINKIGGPICAALLIIGFAYMLYRGYQFRHHYAFAVGTVTAITPPGYKGSGDYSVIFKYTVNGKEYSSNNNRNFCNRQTRDQIEALLVGKQFPVAYWIKGPAAGVMLLTQDGADPFKYTLTGPQLYYDSVLSCK